MGSCLKIATEQLGFLRKGTVYYKDCLKRLRREVEAGGLSLADIGTSEEELEKLRVLGCKTAAADWLNHLRTGTDQYRAYLGHFREEVGKGRLSLAEDLQTSEEELEKLRVLGCKTAATEWLASLRKGTEQYEAFLEYFRSEVEKGCLSLAEDLQTSEEELEKLRVLGCKTAAIQWLECIRRGTKQYESCLGCLRRELGAGGLSLADIGTSEEELARSAPKGEWGGYRDF